MNNEHTNDSDAPEGELTGEARMYDLLCRYVFGEATEAERTEVDAALAASESLRAQKVELDATVALVQGALGDQGSASADGAGEAASASLSAAQLETLESAAREAAAASAAGGNNMELKPVPRGPRPWYASPAVQFAAAATVLLSIGAFYVQRETPGVDAESMASGDEVVSQDLALLEGRKELGRLRQDTGVMPAAEAPLEEAEEVAFEAADRFGTPVTVDELNTQATASKSPPVRKMKVQYDSRQVAAELAELAEVVQRTGWTAGGGGGYKGPGDSVPPGGGGQQLRAELQRLESASSSNDFFLGRGEASPGPGVVNAPNAPETIHVGRSGATSGKSTVDLAGFGESRSVEAPGGKSVSAGLPVAATVKPSVDPAPMNLPTADIGAFFDDGAEGKLKARVEDLYERRGGRRSLFTPADRAAHSPPKRLAKERPRDMFFRFWGDNPYIATRGDALSTFAADVDTASFTLARKMLRDGVLPRRDQIRTEEFVNFPEPDLAAPTEDTFAVYGELAPSPFGGREDRWLLRVGVRAKDVPREDRPPLALTFVVDTSGSMRTDNRLELVKHSLRLLVNQLDARDTLAIVGFNNEAREILPPTPASESDTIEGALYGLVPDGGTNAEAGLKLGYALSLDGHAAAGAQKRVVFLSDGVANLGQTDQDRLAGEIKAYADQGVFLNTIGVGMSNHNDVFLEQLANKGQGVCDYVADAEDAHRAIVDRFVSGFLTVAKDLKIQVEFDGAAVLRWRQLGYENRAVADRDFRNDKVDAGEVGAGHQVTCYYELELASGADDAAAALAKVRLRWKPVDPIVLGARTTETRETESTFRYAQVVAPSFRAATPGFRLGALSAQLAECLRQSFHARGDSMGLLAREFANLLTDAPSKDVAAFAEAVKLSRDLGLKAPPAPQPTDEDAAQQEAYYQFLIESLGGADTAPEGPAATPLNPPETRPRPEAYESRIRELLNGDQQEGPH